MTDAQRTWGRGRQPQADMGAAHVLEVLDLLAAHGVAVWVDGGWAVDALLGVERRPHDDLDLIARLDEVPGLEEALGDLGYARAHGEPPCSFELVDAAGRQVDVHPVRFDGDGHGVYRLEAGGTWLFPAGSLTGTGRILGRSVPCQTPEAQLVAHATGYELDAVHRADAAALTERFALALDGLEERARDRMRPG